MPSNVAVRVAPGSSQLQHGLAASEVELDLPRGFADDVHAEARRAAGDVRLPDLDRTDLPLITIDPEGAMDLDQAVHIARDGRGFVVHYAIADVAAFVAPGGPIDLEAHRRGETLYGAGSKVPLHPPELSEDAASLLPEQVRPALLWTLRLDAAGALTDARVERARVRSTARWSYTGAQAALGDGSAPEVITLLREVGLLREQQERERGGVSLPLPEQEIEEGPEGLRLVFREQLPVEGWNAQVSLLTGMAAAAMMVRGRIGLLRTLPLPDPRDVERLRRVARGLRIDWPTGLDYPEFVRRLDPTRPEHQAMTVACTRLLRGSAYVAFDGELPEHTRHEAIAAEYAHVTAPLRRLGDRYTGEVCVSLCAGEPVPDWVRSALPGLPDELRDSARRASAYERAVLDLLEAASLAGRVGQEFDGVITSVRESGREGGAGASGSASSGVVVVADLGVEAPVRSADDAPLPLGEEARVRLAGADVASRSVVFEWTRPR
ncbi:RNB domain-containing ribonuclease [Nocardioides sp.]|uniref:RNB domain-containing ribonuclease n=1 Tax=Nocardioides sp. TaxID=35761 RepID=UPI003518C249